jgi:hypothetical protein
MTVDDRFQDDDDDDDDEEQITELYTDYNEEDDNPEDSKPAAKETSMVSQDYYDDEEGADDGEEITSLNDSDMIFQVRIPTIQETVANSLTRHLASYLRTCQPWTTLDISNYISKWTAIAQDPVLFENHADAMRGHHGDPPIMFLALDANLGIVGVLHHFGHYHSKSQPPQFAALADDRSSAGDLPQLVFIKTKDYSGEVEFSIPKITTEAIDNLEEGVSILSPARKPKVRSPRLLALPPQWGPFFLEDNASMPANQVHLALIRFASCLQHRLEAFDLVNNFAWGLITHKSKKAQSAVLAVDLKVPRLNAPLTAFRDSLLDGIFSSIDLSGSQEPPDTTTAIDKQPDDTGPIATKRRGATASSRPGIAQGAPMASSSYPALLNVQGPPMNAVHPNRPTAPVTVRYSTPAAALLNVQQPPPMNAVHPNRPTAPVTVRYSTPAAALLNVQQPPPRNAALLNVRYSTPAAAAPLNVQPSPGNAALLNVQHSPADTSPLNVESPRPKTVPLNVQFSPSSKPPAASVLKSPPSPSNWNSPSVAVTNPDTAAMLEANQNLMLAMTQYFQHKTSTKTTPLLAADDDSRDPDDGHSRPSKFTARKAAPFHGWAGIPPGHLFKQLPPLFPDLAEASSTERRGIVTGFFANLERENPSIFAGFQPSDDLIDDLSKSKLAPPAGYGTKWHRGIGPMAFAARSLTDIDRQQKNRDLRTTYHEHLSLTMSDAKQLESATPLVPQDFEAFLLLLNRFSCFHRAAFGDSCDVYLKSTKVITSLTRLRSDPCCQEPRIHARSRPIHHLGLHAGHATIFCPRHHKHTILNRS